MRSICRLAKNNIRNLKPCIHGGKVWEAEKTTKRTKKEILDFSSSVNPLGSSPKALEAIKKNLHQIQAYPDSNSEQLREAIASNFNGINLNNVIVGNGSTELIYLFAETFLEEGEVALIPSPTFSEYENAVKKAGGEPRHINMSRNFCIEPSIFTSQIKDAKMVFLCNPNNPTSVLTSYDTVIAIIEEALKNDVLLFLDQDFLEFADCQQQVSLVDKVNDYPNIFILRSFTKVFGLTGLRIGYGIAHEDTIELLSNVKIPWNVNCLGQAAALAALTDTEHLKRSREIVRVERAFLSRELNQIACFKQYPADANFFLINIKESGFSAAKLKEKMLEYWILIRDCSSFIGLDKYHIRVAVKTRQENQKLIDAFKQVLETK
ncbi:MAG: aminotransferase class I/II [Candidatus Bathyarchaeum sp.]|nr:MAG: aminotransferase class I/II [Candidatus Bathyarchaeum sp.]